MALSKLSKKRRLLIKYLLAEEIEDEELIFEKYGRKRAKTHVMFELRSEEGMYKKLIVNPLVLYLACESCHNEGCLAISSTSISSSSKEKLGAMMTHSLHHK